jgi:predicted outer membrane repeat protein
MKRLAAVHLLIGIAFFATPAFAATYVVNPDGTGDYATIQEAISAAGTGDVIELTDGTFTGDGNRDLNYFGKAITVRSQSGDPTTCIIDCEGTEGDGHRGFCFGSGEGPESVLEGVTVTNGWIDSPRCGGAMWILALSDPTIRNCRFVDNSADCVGGVFCQFGSPTFIDCDFENNSTGPYGNGGGMFIGNLSSPSLYRCRFIHNFANEGGGVFCRFSASPILRDCLFADNAASSGGGLLCEDDSAPTLNNCTFASNAASNGGAVCCRDISLVTIQNTIIAFSTTGSAVHCEDSASTLLNCCDLYGNAGGDWDGCIADQFGDHGNICDDPIFCDLVNYDLSLHSDSPCAWANNPECGYVGALAVGCGNTSDAPEDFDGGRAMLTSTPNPFNPSTRITYSIPNRVGLSHVTLGIYDSSGRLLRSLVDDEQRQGTYSVTWDGRNRRGEPAAAGMYFYQLTLDGEKRTRQLVLVR